MPEPCAGELIMSIVCATHFTASSSDAVSVAAHLARRTGERLWLANVLPRGLGAPGPREALAAQQMLEQEKERWRARGLDVEAATLQGKLDRSVARLCSEVGARLLVVGDHRPVTFFPAAPERLAFGVAVPLLVVRGVEPFQAWRRIERPLHVMLAAEIGSEATVAREWLTWLAAAGPLDVLVTQVWDPAEQSGNDESWVEARREKLQGTLSGLPGNVTSRVHLELTQGGAGEVLPRIAAREKVDLMVLETHSHPGLLARRISVTHEVIQHAASSLALLPSPEVHPEDELSRSSPTSPRSLRERLRRNA
jgi:nucleotide-binding universal stress UspA family protein